MQILAKSKSCISCSHFTIVLPSFVQNFLSNYLINNNIGLLWGTDCPRSLDFSFGKWNFCILIGSYALGLHHTCFFLHFHPQWRVAGNHLMLLVLKYAPFTAKTMHSKEWCLPSVWGHGFFYKLPGMINVAISWCVTAQTPRTHCAYLWNATRFHIAAVLDTLAIRTYCIEDVCKDCCEHF